MPVLKRQHAERYTKDAVVLDLADITKQGEAIRRAASQEADRIVAEARAERERLLSDAREVGRHEGLEAGRTEGWQAGRAEGETAARAEHADELLRLQASWANALAEFLSQREHLLVTCKRDVLQLALSIARRVTHRTIECNEDIVCDQIEAALRLIGAPTTAVIAVHPGELGLAREVLPDLTARIEGVSHAELIADETLGPGSCVIRTAEGGSIDASVQTQLDRIAELIVPDAAAGLRAPDADEASTPPSSDDPGDIERGDLAA